MRRVACVAQEWRPHLQHAFCSSAMRIMAVRAVLIDRLMVMYERTAFLHVAGIAGIDHAIALHQFWAGRSMHIVAVRTRHLAFHDRVVRRLVDLGTLFLVAGEAELGLGAFVAYHIFCRVNLVAVGAPHVASLMCASLPVRALCILLVTLQARAIALVNWGIGSLTLNTEVVINPISGRNTARFQLPRKSAFGFRTDLGVLGVLYVRFTFAMAFGASRRAAVSGSSVPGLADGEQFRRIGFVVAGRTLGIALEDEVFSYLLDLYVCGGY